MHEKRAKKCVVLTVPREPCELHRLKRVCHCVSLMHKEVKKKTCTYLSIESRCGR